MGGLAGAASLNPQLSAQEKIGVMLEAMSHRGPSGRSTLALNGLGLGHLRLLPSSPKQPEQSRDGRLSLAFCGRLYNLGDLATDLGLKGATEAEVMLAGYDRWGPDLFKRLNGAFSLVIWDQGQQELILARDRYGLKPLYYAWQNGNFFFASEQKAILAHPDFQGQGFDFEGLLEYFTFQNFFTDKTLSKAIRLFPPASWARLALNGPASQLDIHSYWDYDFSEPEKARSQNEYLEELDRLFNQAVTRQLSGNEEVGTFLSGGIDSGAITKIAAQQRPWLKTFTCGFDLNSISGLEMGFDERLRAEYMSYLFKTEHYEMVLKAGDMERIMPRLAYHIEEPRVGQSYPNFYASQLVSKFVKVVLAGSGGDELFGGYPWRYYRAAGANSFEQYIDKYYMFWQRLIPGQLLPDVFKPVWAEMSHLDTRAIFKNVFTGCHNPPKSMEDYINLSLYFEAKTFLHGLLTVDEKFSLAHGLETRYPFLDNDLVDFATKIPVGLKLKNLHSAVRLNENEPGPKTEKYFALAQDGKIILREFVGRHLPQHVAFAAKQGFSAPDASWFRGESLDYVKDLLYDDQASIYKFMDASSVKGLLDEHLQGKENRRLFIWSLLSFEHWLKIYH